MDYDDEEDNKAFSEKIISELNGVLAKDSEISSFEIIPVLSNQNKSPVVHVNHNLGLESWCLKHLYAYTHRAIFACRAQPNRLFVQHGRLIAYLNVALLINPDVATFWNLRRQLVERNKLTIGDEFRFSALVLTKKPKSNEAFAYRRWLYLFQSADAIDWSFELSLCEKCADRSASNYHAWNHRQWVVRKASHLLKAEMYKTEKYIRKHVHDYSCYFYRQFVLQQLYAESYYDRDDDDALRPLTALVAATINTSEAPARPQLIATLLPGLDAADLNEPKLESFLYCLNQAAADLRLVDELRGTFGECQAFEHHRRANLKFIVDVVRQATTTNFLMIDWRQPSRKMSRVDAVASENRFLVGLASAEVARGDERHNQWCTLFLGFPPPLWPSAN